MPRMGKHSPAEAASKRARACAWAVFVSMAGTTMSFQVYHSIKHGHLPPPLAVLYGVVPLVISMLLIEVISGWEDAPKWTRGAAYLIIAGSMYLSAAATGAVVLKAAPPHSSLLFGLLLDGAAILAARFLMTGVKRAASAQLAALQSAADAERQARLQADAERDAMLRERDTARAEVAASVAREATLAEEAERLKADAERRQGDTAKATPARRRGDAGPRRSVTQDPLSAAAEVVTLEQARAILEAEPDIAGSELGRRLGFKPSYGRTLKQKVTKAAAGGCS